MKPNQTKDEIAKHFRKLSKNMMIDKITVQKIVEAAGISRQTFYYHFQDIIDLVEWILKSNLEKTLQTSLTAKDSEEALKSFIYEAYENRGLLEQIRYSKNRVEVETILIHVFRAYLLEVIKKYPPKINISFADMELALDYHAYGSIGLLATQFSKNEINLDYLAKQMSRLLHEIHDFSNPHT